MKKLYATLGYAWAVLTILIVLATFLGNNYFSQKLAGATGVTVSPWYSGGEVTQINEHGTYRTFVHRPVFDGLVGERSEGFVQVDWKPTDGLPPVIGEAVVLSGDEQVQLSIRLDTKTGMATVDSDSPAVLGLDQAYRLNNGWAVRVLLHKSR